ncbi:serine/threonine protein kinase [Sporothrix schenckii ATCC 58251]|uniref:Serine/threonine protein kinase n=2 Tax=Sporothrix schenckii TaxID=29908 RepID=U7PR75_SPOS1|nr:serine/threonine protein kinase [Sporothrix schenckii ATCC 58251]
MHRNIVKLVEAYEVATIPGMMYVVITPWVPVTLDDLIDNSDERRTAKFPWFTAGTESTLQCVYRLMRGLADGLAYLHGLSIKHKDLKPDNILLQYAADGQRILPLITDMGLSKTWRTGAATLFTNSTREFLSPEQLDHQESSLKSDIWQLGCCYSWMLTTASGGWQAVKDLNNSYTSQMRSCVIAQEDRHFKKALYQVVAYRGQDQSTQYAERGMLNMVVDGMLDLNPSTRLDIGMVRKEMARLQDV